MGSFVTVAPRSLAMGSVSSYTPVMSDARKPLHELVDQAPEEALPRLQAWLTRLLSPPESSEGSGLITFFPTEPGTTDPEATSAAERERRGRPTPHSDLRPNADRGEKEGPPPPPRPGLQPGG